MNQLTTACGRMTGALANVMGFFMVLVIGFSLVEVSQSQVAGELVI